MAAGDTSTICLFDVDGTLTMPRQKIDAELEEFLQRLRGKVVIGLVGGSDLDKINEQMTTDGRHVTERYDYVFSENGLVAHHKGVKVSEQSIASFMGEEKLQTFINFALKCLSEIVLPVKRGVFVEFRTGLVNICPVGRSCTQQERLQFADYDQKHGIRKSLVEKFKKQFPDLGLEYVIGGQISIDVFPTGWDKRYCLNLVKKGGFDKIYFFGDKTEEGGNDHEIYSDPSTIGHSVTSPADTRQILEKIFF